MSTWSSEMVIGLVTLIFAATFVAVIVTSFLAALFRQSHVDATIRGTLLRGEVARVVTPVPGDGVGRIALVSSGKHITMPAKSFDGENLSIGDRVVIVELDRRTAFVSIFSVSPALP